MTQIRLLFIPPEDNGGSDITNYELWYDEVTSTSNFQMIYNGSSLSYNVLFASMPFVAGKTYRFKVGARNLFGISEFSQETLAAFGSIPNPPSDPFKIEEEST